MSRRELAIQKPLRFVSMDPVRTDPSRRSLPLDKPTFLINSNEFVRRLASERLSISKEDLVPGRDYEYTHVTGDLSLLAAKIAHEKHDDLYQALKELKEIFQEETYEKPKYYPEDLRESTDETIRLHQAMADAFSCRMGFISGLDFLRDPKNEQLRRKIHKIIDAIYDKKEVKEPFDIAAMKKTLAGVPVKEDHIPERVILPDVAVATLPSQLRRRAYPKQLNESLYAAMEGAIAAAVIDQGGVYVSYKGPEVSKRLGGSIIDSMKLLIQMVVFYVLKDTELAKKIESDFIVTPELDGHGFQKKGTISHVRCDPHTLQWPPDEHETESIRKLPFIIYDAEKKCLRPVTLHEFEQEVTIVGGISGAKEQVWLANLAPLGRYFAREELTMTVRKESIRGIGIQSDAKEWLLQIHDRLEGQYNNPHLPPKKLDSPVPPEGRGVDTASKLVAHIATRVIDTAFPREEESKNIPHPGASSKIPDKHKLAEIAREQIMERAVTKVTDEVQGGLSAIATGSKKK